MLSRARVSILIAITAGVVMCAGPARAEEVDRVIATVDGEPITAHDLEEHQAQILTDYGQHEPSDRALKDLIAEKLLDAEVKKYESKVDEAQVDRYVAQIRQQKHLTDEQFRDALMKSGISYDDYRKHARLELEKMEMMDNEVRTRIVIPPSQIQAYYEAHKADFNVEKERLRVAQILITIPPNATPKQIGEAKKKAESLRARASKGEDFYELARRYSNDDSKRNGGELGWFEPGDVNDQIIAALRPLQPGQLSPVVQTKFGFHVLKLEEHEVPGPRPLSEVKDQIRDKLQEDQAQQTIQTWVEKDLVKQHWVETDLK